MRKIEDSSDPFEVTVRASLSTLTTTRIRLPLLEGTSSSATLIASQIELYDELLDELSEIHRNLANYLEHTRRRPLTSGRADLNA